MAETIYDAHVHFGPSTTWLPYINPEIPIEDVLKKMEEHGRMINLSGLAGQHG